VYSNYLLPAAGRYNGSRTSPDSSHTVDELEEEWQYHDGDFPLDLMDEPENITDITQVDTTFQRESQEFFQCFIDISSS
jgi:hypothetical protein